MALANWKRGNDMSIQTNTFAEACYNQNSIEELEQALIDGPDCKDIEVWNLTNEEWEKQVKDALAELREDEKK